MRKRRWAAGFAVIKYIQDAIGIITMSYAQFAQALCTDCIYSGVTGINEERIMEKNYQIAVAGTGYVGLSIAMLLSQHHMFVA